MVFTLRKITLQVTKAHANIALIKYWGKRNPDLHLPTKSSLSITLKELSTTTSIATHNQDCIHLNKKQVVDKKIITFLNTFRKKYNIEENHSISSNNSFPTAAGLASSSSGFAALATGLSELYNLNLSKKELSILARQGSGSACRSIYNGFVIWYKRLEEGTFERLKNPSGKTSLEVDVSKLTWILEGIDLFKARRRKRYKKL